MDGDDEPDRAAGRLRPQCAEGPAEPVGDGTYRIFGQKIYITYGEHDLADNIVHLVLARLPDAPAGTRGISLFLVPKFLVNDDGTLGARNDVFCSGLEHKLGIHASPTCTMIYGDGKFGDSPGAIGWLIGEENRGLACMFTMMNNARLAVGMQGVAIAETAYQKALAYAKERTQGKRARLDGRGHEPDHRTPRCRPHADDHEGVDAGRPRHLLFLRRGHRHGPRVRR
jgi:acyl-CoA dehydrogenase